MGQSSHKDYDHRSLSDEYSDEGSEAEVAPLSEWLSLGRGAPLLAGIRVLELGPRSWTTAIVGRMLARCGAEVVRILPYDRQPASDPCMEFECTAGAKPKVPPVTGQVLSEGKRLLALNPERERDLMRIRRELLPGCDIFLTDLPEEELGHFLLDYPTLKALYPTLVYAQACMMGPKADNEQPGVDEVGAFYSLSGLASVLGEKVGDRGFASSMTASSLFGTICCGLLRRQCGGDGLLAVGSSLRTARWIASLAVQRHVPSTERKEKAGVQEEKKYGTIDSPRDSSAALQAILPFELSGVAFLKERRGHPSEDSVSWAPRNTALILPAPHRALGLPLAGIVLVELSGKAGVSVAGAMRLLADLGAEVIRIEKDEGSIREVSRTPLLAAMNKGKEMKTIDWQSNTGDKSSMYQLLSRTHCLVTNVSVQLLEAEGLGPSTLKQMFPNLIVAFMSDTVPVVHPHGMAPPAFDLTEEEMRGASPDISHDFWDHCGLPRVATAVPPGLGELAICLHLFAGLCAALLHQQRSGEGQVLHLNPRLAGLFSQGPEEPEGAQKNRPWFTTKDKPPKVIRVLGKAGATRDTMHLLRAVGKLPHSWAHPAAWCTFCTSCCSSGDDLQDHQKEIAHSISECTLEEIAQVFEAGDVDWWCEELDAKAPPIAQAADLQASPCGIGSKAWLEARGQDLLVAPALITCSAGGVGIQAISQSQIPQQGTGTLGPGGGGLGPGVTSDGLVPLPMMTSFG